MFLITEYPSSGSIVQYLAKNYKNGSVVSVDTDKVGVMAAYSYTVNYKHIQRVRISCHNTDHTQVNGQVRTILVIFSHALYKAP